MASIQLHSDLAELLQKSEAERTNYFEKLYSETIIEHLLKNCHLNDEWTVKRLEGIINSLSEHQVHIEDCKLEYTGTGLTSLAEKLKQQCPPLTLASRNWIRDLCNALSSNQNNYENWQSIAVPVRSVNEVHKREPLLVALFEDGEFVRNASAHLFVILLLVGDENQITHPFREFCLRFENGQLALGSVAGSLLRVHAEKSSALAAQCLMLLPKTCSSLYANVTFFVCHFFVYMCIICETEVSSQYSYILVQNVSGKARSPLGLVSRERCVRLIGARMLTP